MEIKAGSIVKSASGHDKGLYHAVINIDGDFAFIADGKHRHIDKPKKKRIKHLKPTNAYVDTADLTDKKLRNLLRAYNSPLEPQGGTKLV